MIEASVSALPGLVVSFVLLAVLFGGVTALIAKARSKPLAPRVAIAVYLSGVLAVTLMPGNAGLSSWECDTGLPEHLLDSTSSLLNIALFAPGAALVVLVHRRPLVAASSFIFLSGIVELVQSSLSFGRSCSVTDLAANALGSTLGAALGFSLLKLRRLGINRPRKDFLYGVVIFVIGAAVVGMSFHSWVKPVDIVAKDDQLHDLADASSGADVWISGAATEVFGRNAQVQQVTVEKSGGSQKVTAETDLGKISGWWPQKELDSAWSSNTLGDKGGLDANGAAVVGEKFAQKWFAKHLARSERKVSPIGEGATQAYNISYRRHVGKVMMPLRLDITVTKSGRIMGFTARTIRDPELSPVTVSEAQAKKVAEQSSGHAPGATMLLAARLHEGWRPVWLVEVDGKDIAVDAASGARVLEEIKPPTGPPSE
ncbi:VanZ family protein [Streptomyces sp. NPDC004327]|uniref:VanZ family protein n=1 Tax=Streptomyces sp. NPDC004327 TaxID=3364699 RepID=UPI0036A37683